MFTTSPVAMPWPWAALSPAAPPIATSASPVLTPIRTARSRPGRVSFSSATASRIRRAVRTPRSASSSCAAGAPKTATTASPMNFSIVPSKRSISRRRVAWYASSSSRTSSGSLRSARVVKPTRSQKRTVTVFLSSSRVAKADAVPSGDAQFKQKRARSGFSAPQFGQVTTHASLRGGDMFGKHGRSAQRHRSRCEPRDTRSLPSQESGPSAAERTSTFRPLCGTGSR